MPHPLESEALPAELTRPDAPQRSRLRHLVARAQLGWKRSARELFSRQISSGLSSLAVHVVLLVMLVAFVHVQQQPVSLPMVASGEDDDGGIGEVEGAFARAPLPGPEAAPDVLAVNPDLPSQAEATDDVPPEHVVALVLPPGTLPTRSLSNPSSGASRAKSEVAAEHTTADPPAATIVGRLAAGGGFEGRVGDKRGELLRQGGGTVASEEAVERGLAWLAAHQRSDGSWNFNHQGEACNGYCRNPGNYVSSTAATGLALLPFLGAGHTQRDGQYRSVVAKGLYYLGDKMVLTPQGGDLQEGSMYGHGIATIALCEAYAITRDESIKPFAQSAIDFIVHAQDKNGGGWRYTPGQPGDTTMLGWQLMALKSGKLAGLKVPYETLQLVEKFLDSVQTDYGAGYGYQTQEKRPTTTAIGLLCRMYTGWPRTKDAMVRGVGYLDHRGLAEDDMYYNYYSTQVMRHYGGNFWLRWNDKMREYLIAGQARNGHETGSWYFPDAHGTVGGRLYVTAMAIMTLEVYYRHMPLYGPAALSR